MSHSKNGARDHKGSAPLAFETDMPPRAAPNIALAAAMIAVPAILAMVFVTEPVAPEAGAQAPSAIIMAGAMLRKTLP